MKTKSLMLLAAVFLTSVIVFVGCKKKEGPSAPAPPAKPNASAVVVEVEQTMCPIMDGNKIDKNVFVEYKGKKVYFCCADCKAKFEADPEKYVAKLPQFAK
jgi:YHS domain-containing protein